jgi:hypothetical protein
MIIAVPSLSTSAGELLIRSLQIILLYRIEGGPAGASETLFTLAENEELDRAANHLHNVQVTILHVCVVLKELDSLNNYCMCG